MINEGHEGGDAREELVTLEDIQAAARRIRPLARVTPIIEAPWPGSGAGSGGTLVPPAVFLKCENLQPMGAFKIRGALNMLAQFTPEQLARGVITYSSGNHGQAVALAARSFGVPAVIVMPTTAPRVKAEGAKAYGAEVIFEGTTTTHRKARAEQEAQSRNLTMVPPFDDPWIIAGQGTVGLEVIEQMPDVGTVYVEIGGGGLASGVATAIKSSNPAIRVIGVEPEGAAKMKRSIEAGAPVLLDKTSSIADGLLAVRPGDLTFAHVREYVDEIVTVDDEAIIAAVAWLFRHAHLVVEPSGAITVAAIMSGLGDVQHENGSVVAIISGGNVEPEKYAEYITA